MIYLNQLYFNIKKSMIKKYFIIFSILFSIYSSKGMEKTAKTVLEKKNLH